MVSRLSTIWRRIERRLIAFVSLVAVCASAIPIPVSNRSSLEKDGTVAFPCQHRPCGCRSASQCWQKCCCFTNQQKLAWARVHGVRPPQFVIEAAAQEGKKSQRPERELRRCCSHGIHHSPAKTCGAESKAVTGDASLNRIPMTGVSAVNSTGCSEPQRHDSTRESIVIGVYAQECQGQGWGLCAMACLMLSRTPEIVDIGEATRERCLPVSISRPRKTQEPPVPPPRILPDPFCIV